MSDFAEELERQLRDNELSLAAGAAELERIQEKLEKKRRERAWLLKAQTDYSRLVAYQEAQP